MLYIEVCIGITGYFLDVKPAQTKRQFEFIKKLNFSFKLGLTFWCDGYRRFIKVLLNVGWCKGEFIMKIL